MNTPTNPDAPEAKPDDTYRNLTPEAAQEHEAELATGTDTPTPQTMPIDELLELYQQISSRVAMYNTEILIERMFELRGILRQRFANLEADRNALRGQVEEAQFRIRELETQKHRVLEPAIADLRAQLAAAKKAGERWEARTRWLMELACYHGGGNGGRFEIIFETPLDSECDIEQLDAARSASPEPQP